MSDGLNNNVMKRSLRKQDKAGKTTACRTEGFMKIRAITIMMVITFIVGMIYVSGGTGVKAADTYNASKALEYARNHWNDGKGLCAEFVSNCINAGGVDCFSKGATTLRNKLKNSGMGTEYKLELNSDMSITAKNYEGKLSPGDVVFYYCQNCLSVDGCPFIHAVLCNGSDSNGLMKAFSHNNANNGEKAYYYSRKCWSCKANLTCAYVYHFNGTQSTEKTEESLPISNGAFKVFCGNGKGFVLDVHNFETQNGANLEIYTNKMTNDKNQVFIFENIPGTRYYTIRERNSGKYLHISDGNNKHANVHIWDCKHINGTWELIPSSDGSYYIRNVSNGSYLDNAGGEPNAVNGNNVWTYELNFSAAQRWRLVPEKEAHTQHIYYKINARSGLYILDKASTGSRIGCMPYGTEVEVLEKSSSSKWWKVRWGNTVGYSYSTYLTYSRTS